MGCWDGIRNGNESDVDCGGITECPRCGIGQLCTLDVDCANGLCDGGRCSVLEGECEQLYSDPYGYSACVSWAATSPCVDLTTLPGATPLALGDDDSRRVPLAFSMPFYGRMRSGFIDVSSNGGVTFDGGYLSPGNECSYWGYPGSVTSGIFALWDDWNPSTAGSRVAYATYGVAPDRVFAVQWDVKHFSGGIDPVRIQLELSESGHIRVCLPDTTTRDPYTNGGASATLGLAEYGRRFEISCEQPGAVRDGTVIDYYPPPVAR